ncbi:MAG TPA: SCO family protein [Longimicrobiales bacterium]|nr:SCO family protein [Longimicrobiales bacterium]
MKLRVVLVLAALAHSGALWASAPQEGDVPPLQQATVDERPGEVLPLDLTFVDHLGATVRLGSIISGERPAVLVLAYYDCRNLCSLVLDGVARAMGAAALEPGIDFDAITVSIDSRNRPEDALVARSHALEVMGSARADIGWPFLVGAEPEIRTLAATLGFGYAYDPVSDQFAHPAVVFILTPDGRISSYLYGTTFDAGEIGAALRDAGEGTVRASLHQVLLRCFRYIPALRRYGGAVTTALRTSGLLTVLLLGGWLGRFWWRDLQRKPS